MTINEGGDQLLILVSACAAILYKARHGGHCGHDEQCLIVQARIRLFGKWFALFDQPTVGGKNLVDITCTKMQVYVQATAP